MEQRVLIIDDDAQVREILHEIFLASGYKCELANDGQEGLDAFLTKRTPRFMGR